MKRSFKLLYQAKPGERLKLLPDGRVVVTHPDRPPKIVRMTRLEAQEVEYFGPFDYYLPKPGGGYD